MKRHCNIIIMFLALASLAWFALANFIESTIEIHIHEPHTK